LLLREAKEKIRLIFGLVCRALQQPAITLLVEVDLRVVPSGNVVGANLPRHNQKLVNFK